MTVEQTRSAKCIALMEHLVRFPEDLRDIRRLQRVYAMTAAEVARALESWRRATDAGDSSTPLAH